MFSPRSPLSTFGFPTFIALSLCTLSAPGLAQQTEPTGQMPEAIRGAKIYQLPTKGGQPAANPAVYKGLSFQDINFDRLLLGLSISIRPVDRPATIVHMYFQDVKVNGIPVHIETFDQEFKLSNKETVDLPAPLKCSIVFADLDSMKPVRDMVDKDKIQITGQSFIEVKLNSLEKLALPGGAQAFVRTVVHGAGYLPCGEPPGLHPAFRGDRRLTGTQISKSKILESIFRWWVNQGPVSVRFCAATAAFTSVRPGPMTFWISARGTVR